MRQQGDECIAADFFLIFFFGGGGGGGLTGWGGVEVASLL